jgi:ADP-ribose pyrophosphatase YjhB (NUDIX family)
MVDLVSVSDKDDIMLGEMDRQIAKKKKLWRRVSLIAIKNSKNQILMQQRSHLVDRPMAWNLSAEGHVKFGETYAQAARRELKEEVKSSAKLIEIASFRSFKVRCHYHLFLGKSDGPFRKNKEVHQLVFMGIKEAAKAVKGNKENMSIGCFIALTRYGNLIKNG